MKSPLLKSKDLNNVNNQFSHFYIFSFFSFCIFLVHYSNRTHGAVLEKALGVSPERIALYKPYFTLASFPNAMRQQKNYAGRNTVKAFPFEQHCTEDTPYCDTICRERKEIDPRVIKSPFCINRHNVWESGITGQMECWKSDTMRCWGVETSVWDGAEEWDVVASDLEGNMGVPWIQFNSRESRIRFFVFGWGEIRPYREIISTIRNLQAQSLFNAIMNVGASDMIVLAGHSQGAAWATCLNVVLAQHGRSSIFRHVIGTGTPLADMHFHQRFEALASPAETSSFLLVALQDGGGQILTDITPINRAADYPVKTFPQFGFGCNAVGGRVICLDPQPQQFSQAHTVQIAQDNPNRSAITALHDFGTYGLCFEACYPYFETQQISFNPNTLSFVKTIPSNADIQQPSQFPMLHSSGLILQPPQAPNQPPSIQGQISSQGPTSAFQRPRPSTPSAIFQASASPISLSFPSAPRSSPPRDPNAGRFSSSVSADQKRRGSQVLELQQRTLQRSAGSSSQAGPSNLEQAGYNYPSQFEETGRDPVLPGTLRTIRPSDLHLTQPQERLRSGSRESASSGSGSPNLYQAGSPEEQAAIESLFQMNTAANTAPQMPSRQGSSSAALDQAADALTLGSGSSSQSPDAASALNIQIDWPERSLETGNVSAEEVRAVMDAVLAALAPRPREALNVYINRVTAEIRKQIRKKGKRGATHFEKRAWFHQAVEDSFQAYKASQREVRQL